MEILIASHVKVFLGNKYNTYIMFDANVTSAKKVSEKTIMKQNKKVFQRRI